MSMFLLPLNELGLLPSDKLADETIELLAKYRVWGFFRSVSPLYMFETRSHKYTHTCVHSLPDVQLFSVFINLL